MGKMKLFSFIILSSFVIFTSILWSGCSFSAGVDKGQEAADFKLNNLSDTAVSLSDFKGNKAVLLVFWATWCPYCREEIPELKKIYSKYHPQGLEILALSINESKEKVASFAKKNELPYTILLDSEGKVASLYQVVGIPTNVIIDKKGTIQFKGNALPGDYEALLDKVVK